MQASCFSDHQCRILATTQLSLCLAQIMFVHPMSPCRLAVGQP